MVEGFLAIVGVVTVGSDSSYAAICATPGISEKRRLMLAGGVCVDKPVSAAAVRREEVALPISGDDVGVVVGVTCPTNGEASGAANAIGMTDLFVPVSFDWVDVFSWVVGDKSVAELVVGVTGVNSTKGLCPVGVVIAGVGRRINRWDFLGVEIAGLVSVERMLPVCLALCWVVRSSVGAAAIVAVDIRVLRLSAMTMMDVFRVGLWRILSFVRWCKARMVRILRVT